MERYIKSIKDLVIQTISNGSEIKAKADSGDPLSCFQMGMIHLLGINTSVNFKKASEYLGSQSLSDNQDANHLLGFIAECESNFSQAFHHYAKTASSEKDSYLEKVIMGRAHLQNYLKELDLPTTLNKEVSSILCNYEKGQTLKTDACVKVAAICEDEPSCIEAAKALCEVKDCIRAVIWLKKGNVSTENPIYGTIRDGLEKSKKDLLVSRDLQLLDLDGNSFLSDEAYIQYLVNVKRTCDEASMICGKEWKDKSKAYVDNIIKLERERELQEYLENEARKRKRKKLIKYCAIAATVFLIILGALVGLSDEKENSEEAVSKDVVTSANDDSYSKEISYDNNGSSRVKDDSGYSILSERKLSENDLSDKTKSELEIMRNSIYARHGYKFKREDLLNHFSQYSWYNPTTSDMGTIYNMMNDNERYNIDFIKKHE